MKKSPVKKAKNRKKVNFAKVKKQSKKTTKKKASRYDEKFKIDMPFEKALRHVSTPRGQPGKSGSK